MSKNIDSIRRNKRAAVQHDGLELSYDIVFVLNANSKGWILDKICKIIDRYSNLNCYFLYSERNDRLTSTLPKARAYFFAHFAIAFWTMLRQPDVFGGSIFTYFTHFDQGKGISREELIDFMNLCDHVIAMNSSHQRALVSLGVDPERVTAVIGGADPEVFLPHERGSGIVGFVGAYYARKQPEKMLALIRSMPDVQFLLLAPGPGDVENLGMLWRNWTEFSALQALPNLRYVEAPYEDYPSYFAQMDVYVSLSSQEGGPIPVIEAMMSNVVALATNTGFAEDVLTDDLKDYIIDIDAQIETIAAKVRKALADKTTDMRSRARHISWQSVGETILDIMRPTMAFDRLDPFIPDTARLAFDLTGAGRRFLGEGWVLPEDQTTMAGETASLIFSIKPEQPGRFRLVLELGTDAQSPDVRPVSLALNGRRLFNDRVDIAGQAVIESWFDLSETEAAEKITLTLTVARPEGSEAADEPEAVVLRTLDWVRLKGTESDGPYDYSREGHEDEYTGTQWHPAERTGRWSAGACGSVALFVAPAAEDRMISAQVACWVLGTAEQDGSNLNVRLFVGGETLRHQITLTDDEAMTLSLPPVSVPAGSSGPIVITFQRDRSFRPSDINPAVPDHRDLGLFLQQITLSETEA